MTRKNNISIPTHPITMTNINDRFSRWIYVLLLLGIVQSGIGQSMPKLKSDVTRPWIGPEFMTNPLMNWQLSNGRIENTHGGWVNEVHLLTHQLTPGDGTFQMRVRIGSLSDLAAHDEVAFIGFKMGTVGHRNHYLSNVLHDLQNGFARELMKEPPVSAGITSQGYLKIGSTISTKKLAQKQLNNAELHLQGKYKDGELLITLKVLNANEELEVLNASIPRERLIGNIALVCHGLNPPPNKNRVQGEVDHPRFWFSDWEVSGDKFTINQDQNLGPVLWSQYTLDRGTLKLMTFFVPMSETENQIAHLQLRSGTNWKTVASNKMDKLSSSVLFRVNDWNDQVDQDYRVTYEWNSANGPSQSEWEGTIRKDPINKDTIVMAGLSCSNSDLFPNRFLVNNLIAQDPDIVYFSGDQIYEANGGYGVVRADEKEDVPRAALNYLGKFWLSILGFRELLKDRPTVMTPDDHDLYSNDLWGKGGIPMTRERCFGGYMMHADWVKMVEYTQMGNRPDPYDATLLAQGIRSYTTDLNVGGVSFALVNDRKYKSAPGDVVKAMEPLFVQRGNRDYSNIDTINEEDFDTKTLDRPDLTLLGESQLKFLEAWAKKESAFKAVLHQSVFCQPHHLMVADMDSNGWPQSGRNRALKVIRQADAIMVAGDLHFATLVQQGVEEWEDAGWSFTLPSASTNTHRSWRPKNPGTNRQPGLPDYTGRFLDGWGNKITVWAAANPGSFNVEDPYRGDGEQTLEYLRKSAQGYGIVRFCKSASTITFESWPVYGDFQGITEHQQHPGFPKTITITD